MTATSAHRGRLALVLAITGVVLVVEVVGGLLSGSLALLADAGHMLTDATGLVLALIGANLVAWSWSWPVTFGAVLSLRALLHDGTPWTGPAESVCSILPDRRFGPLPSGDRRTALCLSPRLQGVVASHSWPTGRRAFTRRSPSATA